MLKINPIKSYVSFKAQDVDNNSKDLKTAQTIDNKKVLLSLSGLATAGLALVGLSKTSKSTFEEALKKNGVEIKDGIAKLVKNNERFTGKIERFETRNRKETVNFVDGIMTEKLYHNLLGKELEGRFYKNGEEVLKIHASVGQVKNTHGFLYSGKGIQTYKSGPFVETKEGFAWAREYIKNNIK